MSGLGVHAGLAIAGVVAGLPVAAVVQWNREPPAEVWSNSTGRGGLWHADDWEDPCGPLQRFVNSPTGSRVTSMRACDASGCGTDWSVVTVAPFPRSAVYAAVGKWHVRPPSQHVDWDPTRTITEQGVTWHRVRITSRK